ncbi:hypothetical protein BCR43DRAFT_334656 [Syncephalastrum racemosum]|uniref:KxDL domain-containing protein n=1 Tax=Syncephalastrum racemosum TaxID=13706 RepID=A0A1X2H8C6_SYNRA|nr:hypothetical protein BCR43DRAFT_334656 [Syncephalastrum racemosum]
MEHELAKQLIDARSDKDLAQLSASQQESLATCQAAHQRLEAFNDFSHARYQDIQRRFRSHTATLVEMKRDLDQVFRTLSKVKSKLAQKYPDQMAVVESKYPRPVLNDE